MPKELLTENWRSEAEMRFDIAVFKATAYERRKLAILNFSELPMPKKGITRTFTATTDPDPDLILPSDTFYYSDIDDESKLPLINYAVKVEDDRNLFPKVTGFGVIESPVTFGYQYSHPDLGTRDTFLLTEVAEWTSDRQFRRRYLDGFKTLVLLPKEDWEGNVGIYGNFAVVEEKIFAPAKSVSGSNKGRWTEVSRMIMRVDGRRDLYLPDESGLMREETSQEIVGRQSEVDIL